jgi:methionine aminotransferase
MAGALPLREAIAEKVAALYGLTYDVEQEITVTAGATQAIFTAVAALVRPGDEVIVFEPVYDSYVPSIELNGGAPCSRRLTFPDYRPDWDEVRALVTPRTRMIIINTPHNPSGAVWTAEDMRALEALVRGTGIVIVSDEVYEHIVFDAAQRHESVVRYPGAGRAQLRRLVVRQDLPRHRLEDRLLPGAARADGGVPQGAPVRRLLREPPDAAGAGGIHAGEGNAISAGGVLPGQARFLPQQLEGSRFVPLPCAGTYFQSVRYDAISDEPDRAFVERLTQEHGVAAIPFSAFYRDGRDDKVIRFCFAKGEETLARGWPSTFTSPAATSCLPWPPLSAMPASLSRLHSSTYSPFS